MDGYLPYLLSVHKTNTREGRGGIRLSFLILRLGMYGYHQRFQQFGVILRASISLDFYHNFKSLFTGLSSGPSDVFIISNYVI